MPTITVTIDIIAAGATITYAGTLLGLSLQSRWPQAAAVAAGISDAWVSPKAAFAFAGLALARWYVSNGGGF